MPMGIAQRSKESNVDALDKRRTRWLGFSLVELMAVVTVLGILVSLALPRFRVFIARSRQGEAIHNLGLINKLQMTYNLKAQAMGWGDDEYHSGLKMGMGESSGKCGSSLEEQLNTLGFRVEDCLRLRYTYYTRNHLCDNSQLDCARNTVADPAIYPGCNPFFLSGEFDRWTVDIYGSIANETDIVKHCQQ